MNFEREVWRFRTCLRPTCAQPPIISTSHIRVVYFFPLGWKYTNTLKSPKSISYIRVYSWSCTFCSVQFSCSVMSDSLWPHGLQHARTPCPSPTPEYTRTHVHWVKDAFQPSHPLSSPSPHALNLSHQGLLKCVNSLYQVAKLLRFQLQHQSFQWTFRTDFLSDGLAASPFSPRSFSNTTVQKHQFCSAQLSL